MERVGSLARISRRLSFLASFGLWALVPAKHLGADRAFGSALGSAICSVFLLTTFAAAAYTLIPEVVAPEDRPRGRFLFVPTHLLNFIVQGVLAVGLVHVIERVF